MILGVWLVVCVALNVALKRRIYTLLGVALACWVLVPGAVGDQLTGVRSLHGATVLILVSWLGQMVSPSGLAMREITNRPILYVCLGLFLFLSVAESVAAGSRGASGLLNMAVVPILLFHLLQIAMAQSPVARQRFATWFVALAVVESCMAIAQALLQQNLFWVSNFESAYTWYTDTYVRSQGTLDQPIILGAFCVTAIPLLAGYRRMIVVLPLTFILIMGIATAGARSALIFVVPAVLSVVFRSRFSAAGRTYLVGAIGVGAILIANSAVASPILSHLDDGGDSTDLRAQAYAWFFDHWTSYLLNAGGYGSSYAVSDGAGLGSSFESAAIMFFFDFGIVAVLLYFGAQAYLVLKSFASTAGLRGASVAALAAVYIPFTYSSYDWTNASAVITWSVLAVAFVSPTASVATSAVESPVFLTRRFPGSPVAVGGRTDIRRASTPTST